MSTSDCRQHFDSLGGGFFAVEEESHFSWTIVGFSAMVWGIIACLFWKFSEAAKVIKDF